MRRGPDGVIVEFAGVASDGMVGPFRLGVTDSAALSSDDAAVVDADGVAITGPLEPGSLLYLRPGRGRTATVDFTIHWTR